MTDSKSQNNTEILIIVVNALMFLLLAGFANIYVAIVITAIINAAGIFFILKRNWQNILRMPNKVNYVFLAVSSFIFAYYVYWIW